MPHFARLPCIISLRRVTQLPLRTIVTSSIAPSLDAAMERPESIVLTESSLYHYSNSHHKNKWTDAFQSFYPSQGLHFSSIDLFRTKHISISTESSAAIASLKSLEQGLAIDLLYLASTIGIGATHTVLIARGPIQSLVAQYFLESLPLAGLVLVDPLLLPNDGRVMNDPSQSSTTSAEVENRWNSSLQDLISLLDGKTPNIYKHYSDDKTLADKKNHASHLLLLDDEWRRMHPNTESKVTTSFGEELSLLDSLSQSNNSRPLLLERGTIPMLICYSGSNVGNEYEDYYRVCAERTAAFHTCGGSSDYFDQVSVLRIPTQDTGGDDLDILMKQIYEWYDVAVA